MRGTVAKRLRRQAGGMKKRYRILKREYKRRDRRTGAK